MFHLEEITVKESFALLLSLFLKWRMVHKYYIRRHLWIGGFCARKMPQSYWKTMCSHIDGRHQWNWNKFSHLCWKYWCSWQLKTVLSWSAHYKYWRPCHFDFAYEHDIALHYISIREPGLFSNNGWEIWFWGLHPGATGVDWTGQSGSFLVTKKELCWGGNWSKSK